MNETKEKREDMEITPEEAAELLSVTPHTIRRWIREGIIEARKVGFKNWWIKRSELDRVVSDNKKTS